MIEGDFKLAIETEANDAMNFFTTWYKGVKLQISAERNNRCPNKYHPISKIHTILVQCRKYQAWRSDIERFILYTNSVNISNISNVPNIGFIVSDSDQN